MAANPNLPQVSTQGGPNAGGYSVDITQMPGFMDSMAHTGMQPGAADTPAASAQLTGDARAAMIQQIRSQQAATGANLPQYNPGAPSNLNRDVDPNATGLSQMLTGITNEHTLNAKIASAQQQVGNTGVGPDMANWLFGAGGTPQEYAAKKAANATLSSNAMADYLHQYPSLADEMVKNPLAFAQRVGPMLEAAQAGGQPGVHSHVGPDGVPVQKVDSNPALTQAFSDAHGVNTQAGHAGLETTQYSLPEFLHATQGLTRGQLSKMWEMQHYLDPRSQAMATGMARAQQAALNEPQTNTANGTQSTKASDDYDKLLRQIITGMPQQ